MDLRTFTPSRGTVILIASVSLALVAAACRAPEATEPPAPVEPALANELLSMARLDQDARGALLVAPRDADGNYGPEGQSAIELIRRLDRTHTDRLEQIVAEYGWPGRSLVGDGGSHAAWLLVQHADHSPDFQARCLSLLRDAVEEGEADPGP